MKGDSREGVGVEVEKFLYLPFVLAQGAGEAGEANGGDGGGVCADGDKAGAQVLPVVVEFCGGGGVEADEGVDGFAAGGVYGGDGVAELGEAWEPCFGGEGV